MTALPESNESLFSLAASPLIWALHLLLSYVTAAIWCAKAASPDESLAVVQLAIFAYTLASLLTVSVIGLRGFRRHRYGASSLPHDADSRADRHRFLGFAAFLLSGLSAIAIVFQALTPIFIGSCR
jgi:hypothetical protein